MRTLVFPILSAALLSLVACRSIPSGVTAVKPFYQDKYLGKWYEIARMDYKYERNLDQVTAEYGLKPNGKISVLNKGYNHRKQRWEESKGKAKPSGDAQSGALKVSFFGPFYAGYNVIALAGDYDYALVAGKNRDYLWLLSRHKTMPEQVKKEFLQKARSLGYDTEKLVWVKQG